MWTKVVNAGLVDSRRVQNCAALKGQLLTVKRDVKRLKRNALVPTESEILNRLGLVETVIIEKDDYLS